MTEEIRPICLYVETCLDRKEGTRDCTKCEHHLNYWTEVMIRDMEKNITRLEQENKELKEKVKSRENELTNMAEQANTRINNYRSVLEEIREDIKYFYSTEDSSNDYQLVTIIDKINEVLGEN